MEQVHIISIDLEVKRWTNYPGTTSIDRYTPGTFPHSIWLGEHPYDVVVITAF